MGEIRIEIEGVVARLVNGQWHSKDKDLAQLLRDQAEVALDPMRYYPDKELALAKSAAHDFDGKIVHVDPLYRPTDQGHIY